MKKILVTGGTTFVSKYVAEYFVESGYEVYALNRNTKPQVPGVKLIEGDRHNLNGILKNISFDVVADITAYNEKDITDFIKESGSFEQYIMISSSAVYPDNGAQPFLEESEKAVNKFWDAYGTDKIAAEKALLEEVLGKTPAFINVHDEIEQRNYFSFYNYEYCLDVSRQCKIYPETISLEDGLKEAAEWYLEHNSEVKKKPFFEFIDGKLAGR